MIWSIYIGINLVCATILAIKVLESNMPRWQRLLWYFGICCVPIMIMVFGLVVDFYIWIGSSEFYSRFKRWMLEG